MFEEAVFISNALDKDTSIKWTLINQGFSVMTNKNSEEGMTVLVHTAVHKNEAPRKRLTETKVTRKENQCK